MRILVNSMIFLTCAGFVYSCTASKKIYYSYKENTYIIDSAKHLLYDTRLISYGDDLFEFIIKAGLHRSMKGNSLLSESRSYDTVGVYLLSGANKLFYEFDKFSLENNVRKVGKLENKPLGERLKFSTSEPKANVSYGPLERIVINNIPCFASTVISNDSLAADDSVNQKVLLIKKPHFNSLFKIRGVKFIDSHYCIIGVQLYDRKQKQGFFQEIDQMRVLTEGEKAICKNMLEASKKCIVDTVR
jgi:hypothetical protein